MKALELPVTNWPPQKYRNTAHPSIGYANACQMVLNHLEYYERIIDALKAGIDEYPENWGLPTANWMEPLWKARAKDSCELLASEIQLAEQNLMSSRMMVSVSVSVLQQCD